MRNFILTLVLLAVSAVGFGQNTCRLVLKPNKTETKSFKIDYKWRWCRSTEIKVEGVLDVNKETITLKMSYKANAKRKKLDYVWFPTEAVEYDEIKSYLSTENRTIKQAFVFGRQHKKGKWNDDSQAFTSTNAEIIGCYLTSGDEENYDYEQKMLRLDGNSYVTLKLLVLKNSENVRVEIDNIVPIVDKKKKKKNKLIYQADKVVIDIIVDRTGCYGNQGLVNAVNEELNYYKEQERDLILKANNATKADYDSIEIRKNVLLSFYRNNKNYDTYRNSECFDVRESMREIDSICQRIENLDGSGCFDQINELKKIQSNLLQRKNVLTECYDAAKEAGQVEEFMKEKDRHVRYANNLDLKKFERSECAGASDYLKKVKNLKYQIIKIGPDCKNSSQIMELKDRLNKAAIEINELYNNFRTSGESQKGRIKSDRDKICNDIDAEIESLSDGCKTFLSVPLGIYYSAKNELKFY